MKKQKIFSAAASALILLSILTACASSSDNSNGGNGGTTTQNTTASPSTMKEEQQSQVEEIAVKEFELENKEITFLATWARNPANGKNKDVAIELFQNRFGGKINDIVVGDAERYDKLASLVSTGNSPDFFSAADSDAFPMGAINNMFQPIDDYIDYSDQWWSSRKEIGDQFVLNDKHYVAAISPEVEVVMIYNKAVIEENGLPDPYQLLKEDKWDWTACMDMMRKFCDKSEEHYATDGWWITTGFCNSTGVPFIGMKDGIIVNNVKDALIGEAQEFLYTLNKENMAYPVWDYGWVSNPANIGIGKTLFYPVGFWALTEVNTQYGLNNFGDPGDVGFVPVPKCPSADAYYIPARVNGYLLCSGAPNPEGFACMMYCEAAANGSQESEDITKEQYFNEYGWTDEMWEMRETMYEMLKAHPVFEYSKGISRAAFDALDNPSKDAYHSGASWTQTKETVFGAVQSEVDKANASLTN